MRTACIARRSAHPANLGRLCSKGAALGDTLDLTDRLLHPMIGGRDASWDEALGPDRRASFAQTIAQHGPDSVAFYVSGQMLTEDYYVANKLMKGFIGARQHRHQFAAVHGVVGGRPRPRLRRGRGARRAMRIWNEADLVVLVGSNAAWCHPVLYQRLMAAASRARHEDRGHRSAPHRHGRGRRSASAAGAGSDVAAVERAAGLSGRDGALDREWIARHVSRL